jgi:spectinomycin phosphotransferase
MSEVQWHEFGKTLRQIHAAALPSPLLHQMRHETYTPHWRNRVKTFLQHLDDVPDADPTARELAAYLPAKRAELEALITRTEELAYSLQVQRPDLVVCHSDLHAGNFLISDDAALFIVDWDDPILAPKERDLMYVGGGQHKNWRTPEAEAALFYPAYGPTHLNPVALAYYRYERIIQDIAVECEHIFLTTDGDEDRRQSLHYLQSNFRPGGVLEISYQADTTR